MTEREKIRHYLKTEMAEVEGGFARSVVDNYLATSRKRKRAFLPISPLLFYVAITTVFLAAYLMLPQISEWGRLSVQYFGGTEFDFALVLIVAFSATLYLYFCDRSIARS